MLPQIVQKCSTDLAVDTDTATKLVAYVDIQKIKGLTGGEAAEKLSDYLGFLQLPYTEQVVNWFAERWLDHRVWINIPDDLKKYLNSDTPIFTPSRLEPIYSETPFYDQGVTKVDTGVTRNPEDNGCVRKAPPLTEDYQNFIVNEYLPEHFYMEIPNSTVEEVLKNGLDETTDENPYYFYSSIKEARNSLVQELKAKGLSATLKDLEEYTLMEVDADSIPLNNDIFYPRKLHGHRQAGRMFGYFYTGSIKPTSIKVAKENIK